MNDMVERYIQDVVQRIPENERAEVGKELAANIGDMLPDGATEEEVKGILYELGSPAALSREYRQNPRYLLSPAVFDQYINVLKWLVPLVACTLLVVGMIYGAVESISDGRVEISAFIADIIAKGISFAVDGGIQALMWTTVGFIIAERTGYNSEKNSHEWKVEDLPEISKKTGKYGISLSDSIAALIVAVIAYSLLVLLCLDLLPTSIIANYKEIEIVNIFAKSFIAMCIPMICIAALLEIVECVVKIAVRNWTPIVCGVTILGNIISTGITVYLFTRPVVFSEEVKPLLMSPTKWGSFDIMRIFPTQPDKFICATIIVIVVIIGAISCGRAIYRTVRNGAQ